MSTFLNIFTLLFFLIAPGCDLTGGQQQADKEAATRQAEVEAARVAGEAISAQQEDYFRPTPEESRQLDSSLAVNSLGTANGYFTNSEGISGYFSYYDHPFNFIWRGATTKVTGIDGQEYQMMDGPGELLIKYKDDNLLIQRFKGDFKEGLWRGHGDLWTRNDHAGGHNYMSYQGEVVDDKMEGRGTYTDYNFSGDGETPWMYEGQMHDDGFHGQGNTTDLVTGAMLYKGLWLDGSIFEGSWEDWQKADSYNEINQVSRQYQNLLSTGLVDINGLINHPQPGEGALTVIYPLSFTDVVLTYQAGPQEAEQSAPTAATAENGRKRPPTVLPKAQPTEVPSLNERGGQKSFKTVVDPPASDYPLTLNMSYQEQGKKQYLRVTVKRPFTLIVNSQDDYQPVDDK